jgi:hypothetical protein
MKFLDKLLGRNKATDEKNEAAVESAQVHGENDLSEVGQAEERLDDTRDEAFRTQGRMP